MIDFVTKKQFNFSFVISLILHVILLFGITFSHISSTNRSNSLAITLAVYDHKTVPMKVDYIAQFNQHGSGTLEDKKTLRTLYKTKFQDNEIHKVAELDSSYKAQIKQDTQYRYLTSLFSINQKILQKKESKESKEEHDSQKNNDKNIDLEARIASLEAQFHHQQQQYAKRPKIKRLTTLSSKSEAGAYYKEMWRQRIEYIGNLHYPEIAKINKIYGELRLLVIINKNGSLNNVQILKSSQSSILDDAAKKIVQLAAPYLPFDNTLNNYDRVEIIRTWRFDKDNKFYGD